MRYEPLRKRVLLELGIYSALLLVLCGGVYFLMTIVDDYHETNANTKRGVDAIDAEFNMLKGKYTYIQQNSAVYEEVKKKQAAGELSINRPTVMDKFNQLKEQYSINNLRVSVAPVQDAKDPAYVRKTNTTSSSDVSVDMDSLSDENVYGFMDGMLKGLSGVCKITKVSMTRDHVIDDTLLEEIKKTGSYPIVKTSIKFTWFSINPVPEGGAVPNAPR